MSATIDGIPVWRFLVRMLWVAIRVLLVVYLGQTGIRFFYQGF